MIACRGLAKNFGDLRAVSGASFQVKPGSVCALLGPNGAGKSTLVKMLTGLLRPSGGAAEVCGIPIEDPALKGIAGVLPESLALFDALTVQEHLELTGAVYKLPTLEIRSRTDQLLRVLQLEHGRHTFIHQCSFGMKKKTALAMALLPNPRALFLDEPFEGLDPISAQTIRNQLRGVSRRGVTVLLTSHILPLIVGIADQVVMINRGGIVLDSEVAELPKPLEELYFELAAGASGEDLEWLGSASS
jgi:ABC-2 type transport system ATP-binding protein